MVIGEVKNVGWGKITPDLFFDPDDFQLNWYIALGRVPIDYLLKYAKKKTIYANLFRKAKRYEKAKEIICFNKLKRPPQSWCYVEEIK